jgi:regulatory protein
MPFSSSHPISPAEPQGELQKAKAYAFLLLKFRQRSEKELYQRLKKKNFTGGIINQVIDLLKQLEFIDDSRFADAWIESRLKKHLGLLRIKAELSAKGIDEAVIESKIRQARQDYPEAQIVAEIAKSKFKKLKKLEILRAKQRIYGYLMRRGFPAQLITEVLSELTGNEQL